MDHRDYEWQLVFFTFLTHMASGTFCVWGMAAILIPIPGPISNDSNALLFLTFVLILLIFGALAAGLHLGRPLRAIFSLTNLRSSWLSREALLGINFGLVVLVLVLRRAFGQEYSYLDEILIAVGILVSFALVYCISRLYMLRTVPAWNNPGTPGTFFVSTSLLGVIASTTIWQILIYSKKDQSLDIFMDRLLSVSGQLLIVLAATQLVILIFQILYLNYRGGAAIHSLRLLWSDLRGMFIGRVVTLISGISLLTFQSMLEINWPICVAAAGLILISEFLGRILFYGFYQQEGF